MYVFKHEQCQCSALWWQDCKSPLTHLQMFGGFNRTFKHKSSELGCDMAFTVYYPPQSETKPCPVRSPAGYRSTGTVWQAVNTGKAPSKPETPILSAAVHVQLSGQRFRSFFAKH